MQGKAGWVGMGGDSYSVPATGVQNSSHLGTSVTFTMPFTFSFEKYAYMIYVYGFCDGNSVLAVAEYQQRFLNRRIPNRRVFTGVYQALRDTGRLPGVCIAAELVLMKVSMKKALFVWYTAVHVRTREELQDTACRGHVSIPRAASATSRTWRFC